MPYPCCCNNVSIASGLRDCPCCSGLTPSTVQVVIPSAMTNTIPLDCEDCEIYNDNVYICTETSPCVWTYNFDTSGCLHGVAVISQFPGCQLGVCIGGPPFPICPWLSVSGSPGDTSDCAVWNDIECFTSGDTSTACHVANSIAHVTAL